MITGKGGGGLAQGHRGAFFNTLQQLHTQWEQINVITPTVGKHITQVFFGNVFVHASPWPIIFQPLFILRKGIQLFRNQPFQMMTVHEYPPFYNGIGAWLLHRKIGVPYLLEVMHFPGKPKASNLKERIYSWMMQWLFRFEAKAANGIRVINRHETPKYLAAAGVPKSKLIYIPAFYIDLETFKPEEREKEFDLLFVGRLVANKGVFLFLDTVRQMPSVKACIVGDGPERSKIESYVAKYGLQARVKVHGWAANAQEIATIMNRSKLIVMASYNEGGPRVVLEAMACGVPVLATPVGIVPDVVPANQQISWDVKSIIEHAQIFLKDHEAYGRARQHGFEQVPQFERAASIKAYADALKRFLQ